MIVSAQCHDWPMSTQVVTIVTLMIGLISGLGLGLYIGRSRSQNLPQSTAVIESLEKQLDEFRKRENESTRLDETLRDVKERMAKLSEQTQQAEVKRAAADAEIRTQIEAMRTGNESLTTVATKLEGALSNSQARGKYGEVQLELILEKAGLIEGVHYEKQETSRSDGEGSRPDITISLPGSSKIFIDSKFPFQRFLEAVDEKDPVARESLMQLHAKDLMAHLTALAKRQYQGDVNSPDFVVLFAPFESILAETLKADPQFLNNAFEKNVTIATPTNMMALLKSVAFAFNRNDFAQNALNIQRSAAEFLKRVSSLHQKLATLGDRLKSTERAFNDVISTAETSILRPARTMISFGASSAQKLTELPQVDDEVRQIKSTALELDYIDAEVAPDEEDRA